MTIKMQRVTHNSRFLSLGYDLETETLAVEFAPGVVWHYSNVSASQWERMGGVDAGAVLDGLEYVARKNNTKRRVMEQHVVDRVAG